MNYDTALLDARVMGEADRLAVVAGASVSQLTDNAGREGAHEVMRRWPVRRVTVLCGPGNNGGDGFVAARLAGVLEVEASGDRDGGIRTDGMPMWATA